jgi:epoxyqueuosine reductase
MITVAVGGTFNILHDGHRALLTRAFELGELVHIGLTSDEFATGSRSIPVKPYEERRKNLLKFVKKLGIDRKFTIMPITDAYGVTLERDLDYIVVSPETEEMAQRINEIRSESGKWEIGISVVDHVLADDGQPISSTRVANREINPDGSIVLEFTEESFPASLVETLRDDTWSEPILIHTCCAPCLAGPLSGDEFKDYIPIGYFYNPNIQPFGEYRKRLEAVQAFSLSTGIRVIYRDRYDLKRFMSRVGEVGFDREQRCRWCYEDRLDRTARTAHDLGFTHFSTSLLSSPHQMHDIVKEIGEKVGKRYGVTFVYFDSRDRYVGGVEQVRVKGLHIQNYCGCIFSEEERFGKQVVK